MKLTQKSADDQFNYFPLWHTYSLGHIHLVLSLVLSAAASIRGAGRSVEIMFDALGINMHTPSWYSVRLWLLRLGYYKLTRPKEIADDWIWIIDHTIQCGKEKCLAIVGVRQSALPDGDTTLYFEDIEPLALYPVTRSNGEIVFQQLQETIAITGVPRQILSDGGPDIKAGVNHFLQVHTETCFIYDIKHKAATIIKRLLGNDKDWNDFIERAAHTRKQLFQTDMAHLVPPTQRSKARYMNIDRLVKWANEKLLFIDQQNDTPESLYDLKKLENRLGWLKEYRLHILEWMDLVQVSEEIVDSVRFHGVYHNCHKDLLKMPWIETRYPIAKGVRDELIDFLKSESQKANPHERLVGSSEIIESLFGKLKFMEKDQSQSGFTSLLLALAASVSKTTKDTVRKAIETVPTIKVYQWFKENIGESVQSKRKEVKRSFNQKEQIREQNTVGANC